MNKCSKFSEQSPEANLVKLSNEDDQLRKSRTEKARCQFHQHFMSSFCANILGAREKLQKILLYKKGECKMLMKLTTAQPLPIK